MSHTHRREFLQSAGESFLGAAATATLLQTAAGADAKSASANQRVVVGLIGCGGRGTAVAKTFASQSDVRVAYVCDPDESRSAKAADALEKAAGHKPRVEKDLRKLLDDKSLDAVIVATPDHWHAPATILAVDAQKHVYVEKPCSHNVREGRLMIEAARRNGRVVQVGTQSRSGAHLVKAMELLESGAIGDVLVAKAWNSQLRKNIGHGAPSEAPPGLDYDLWLGPAPKAPFQANRLHYSWHWWYDFGTGDMGNDGVHDLDIARWGLGVQSHPNRVSALGGKCYFDDDQEFPDTQYVVFEYDTPKGKRELVFEQRIWSPYRQEGFENGNAFYGAKGMMLLGKNDGWQLFGPKNKLIESMGPVDREAPHARNFLDCIKTGDRPNADIEIGHLSSSLCHLGNIATRLARKLEFDPQTERFVGDDAANDLIGRKYREGHWAVPAGG